jgi:hypothetical protein
MCGATAFSISEYSAAFGARPHNPRRFGSFQSCQDWIGRFGKLGWAVQKLPSAPYRPIRAATKRPKSA